MPAMASVDILDPEASALPAEIQHLSPTALRCVRDGIAVNSTANLDSGHDGRIVENGNRTECALLRFACSVGGDIASARNGASVLAAAPFSSERKCMTVLVRHERDGNASNSVSPAGTDQSADEAMLYCKGAAEVILRRCTRQMLPDGSSQSLNEAQKQAILDTCHGNGLRLVAIAQRAVVAADDAAAVRGSGDAVATAFNGANGACASLDPVLEEGLELVALFGIRDEVRPEVPGAVKSCQEAGITVRMLTGDSAITAASIAYDCGILDASALAPDGSVAMEGQEFSRRVHHADGTFDQNAFNTLWPKLRVLARCSPRDKYTIIKGCQAYRLPDGRRDIVAMTGDGTNDAPALRLADVGFAMISGTSIARQASDILLMDDNFLSIVQSVKWGRNVYASIIKFLQFQLTINIVAVVTAIAGVTFWHQSPLTPVQMLWVNMIMDSLASLSLATEAPTPSMLKMPPFSSKTSLLTPTCVKHIAGQATYQLGVMALLLMQSQQALNLSNSEHLTFVFNTFVVIQLFNQVACRKAFDEQNIFDDLFSNRIFLGVLGVEAVLQVLIVQCGGDVFNTVPLSPTLWLYSAGFGALSWIVRFGLLGIPTAKFELLADAPADTQV